MMATHRPGSFWNSSKTSDSSALPGGWRAFMTSGRLIVTMNRCPSRSVVLNCPMRRPYRGPAIRSARSAATGEATGVRPTVGGGGLSVASCRPHGRRTSSAGGHPDREPTTGRRRGGRRRRGNDDGAPDGGGGSHDGDGARAVPPDPDGVEGGRGHRRARLLLLPRREHDDDDQRRSRL